MVAAGCYCDSAARRQQWRLVLETNYYALGQEADCQSAAS